MSREGSGSEKSLRKTWTGTVFWNVRELPEIWRHPYYEDCRSDDPEQFRVIGWAQGRLYSVIYELRRDEEGEYYHLVTLWKSTREEEKLDEKNA